jgi:hypothetical protein
MVMYIIILLNVIWLQAPERDIIEYLEPCWAPIDELNGPLVLNAGDGAVHILRDDVTAVQETASHVFT